MSKIEYKWEKSGLRMQDPLFTLQMKDTYFPSL